MKKLLGLAMVMSFAVASSALGAGPWSLFGGASYEEGGSGNDPWMVSLVSDTNTVGDGDDWSGIDFMFMGKAKTFAEITHLSTDYNVTDDDCGGGSPRFQINVDTDDDGEADGNVFVYIGEVPNFTDCESGWQSTGNLIASGDARFDTSQVGGTFYDTHENAVALVGDAEVTGVELVVDSGWMMEDSEQTINVDTVRINNNTLRGQAAR